MRPDTIIGIYTITSPSGRVYIGQSWDIRRRWYCHRQDRRADGLAIRRSFAKHGVDEHSFEVIHRLSADATQNDLNYWERFYIERAKRNGIRLLNMTDGGSNGRPTDEVRAKLRQPKSNEHRARISRAVARQWAEGLKGGKSPSSETRSKISTTMTGRTYSAERVAKASSWERTPECRAKIAKALQGRSATVKLTPQQVIEIRSKYQPRVYPFRRLASEYGVDNKTIRAVVARKTWAHV